MSSIIFPVRHIFDGRINESIGLIASEAGMEGAAAKPAATV
jgi:hypothetical protein